MKLYLVQHAEAVSKEVDPDRPLSADGRRDAKRVAAFLASAKVNALRIVHSGKTRAQQTAEILAQALSKNVSVEPLAGLNPNDPPQEFLKQIEDLGDGVIVVGHLPFLAKLVSRLITGEEEHLLVHYQPGSVVCLEQDEGGGWMLRPGLFNP